MSYQNTDSSIEILTNSDPQQPVNGDQNIRINRYETSMPMRIDIEAACTYVLGCVSGVIFLILETKNDYVRFHAWQSSILFSILLVLNFLFLNTFLIHLLVLVEFGLIFFLAYQAYINADSLLRYEFPIVGRVASDWVDDE
ncbi:hypothetical protein H8356DRAFT_1742639 [Neocallimastix lanati (nom. inval.)]|jgi:uncharacterized membrane protein|uniref:Uncharacterized protein n=1 Tax=Neocallimastix californiae TaxID=1754190 RepID=A0A1Y2EXU4_9FUNG|nr:hypothetical protein H8356DRAFT_1742639 [Neocallimastix sp. JGI-2020a]ORY76441.1 hypothetical protein LY90DRAFT_114062 [Neocallimastix californiae]|eukprot:ORY76441.1 hypothetical protein LY90DRAFT_114062 [Neocallimastix californiae]